MSFLERFAVMNEERLDRLLGRLLAVVNGYVVKRWSTCGHAAGGFQLAPRFDGKLVLRLFKAAPLP